MCAHHRQDAHVTGSRSCEAWTAGGMRLGTAELCTQQDSDLVVEVFWGWKLWAGREAILGKC